jgi:hypothetical protein
MKRITKIGVWNVRTLLESGRLIRKGKGEEVDLDMKNCPQ